MDICPTCKRPLRRRRYVVTIIKLTDTAQEWRHELTVCKGCVDGVIDALEPVKRSA